MAGKTRFINQILRAAACIPIMLSLYNENSATLADALTGNSVNPIVGAIAIIK